MTEGIFRKKKYSWLLLCLKFIFYQKISVFAEKKKHAANPILQAFSSKCFCHFIKVLKMNKSALVLVKYSDSFERNVKNSENIIFNTFLLLPWQPFQILNKDYTFTIPVKFQLDMIFSLKNGVYGFDSPFII